MYNGSLFFGSSISLFALFFQLSISKIFVFMEEIIALMKQWMLRMLLLIWKTSREAYKS